MVAAMSKPERIAGDQPRPGLPEDGVAEVSRPGGDQPRPGAPWEGVAEVGRPLPDDAAIAAHARRHHGRVTLAQLRAAGLGKSGASRRAQKGQLHRKHRTVYAVGHDADARWAAEDAALLAAGDDAVIGWRSALEVWGALPQLPNRDVDVI